MKKIYKNIMLLVMAFAVASCAEDEIIENKDHGKAGQEVQFGLSLANSRTVYGPEGEIKDETTGAVTNRYFPLYWSEGDKVQIFSPECATDRNDAEYSVKPVSKESYAESLTKTGDYGVQWGQSEKANFYSVYPSTNATFQEANGVVTAKLNIGATQTANYLLNVENGKGVYYVADMQNVIMYAETNNVKAGDVVTLQYTPFSTILEFEISATGTGTALVSNITLEADEPIVGDFNLTFNGGVPSVLPADNNSNSNTLVMNFGVKPELNSTNSSNNSIKNSTMRVKMCLMPNSVENIDTWKLTITTLEGGKEITHTKTFSGTDVLKPGKIHKVKLPTITANKAWEYKPAIWMTQIPEYETIYLTEYSIPGAWYAHDAKGEGYQVSGESISNLWENGVRAFALECRASSTYVPSGFMGLGGSYEPSSIVISGTQDNGLLGDYTTGGTKIREIIKSIADEVAGTKEFAVLVLSYADGGTDGQRAKDHNFFINGVKVEIEASKATNIYEEEITSETITSEVLGQLIVKINVDKELSKSSYDNSSNALFSYVPHMNQLTSDNYATPLFSKLYWKTWEDSYESFITEPTTDFLWCFSSANRTHVNPAEGSTATYDIPTYSQRKTALNAMMDHSDEIYENSTHNVWFYFNAGGVEAESQGGRTTIANYAGNMNPWLLDVINRKTNGGTDEDGNLVYSKPSPLGIVMFNQCTSETGKQIIRAIIEMNNKFDLKHYVPKTDPDNKTEGGIQPF